MELNYLNTAACGIVPATFTEEANSLYAGLSSVGSAAAEKWRDDHQPAIKENVASFIGADIDEVALIPNFSWGLNGIVQSLKGTKRVLLYKKDYPSLTEPFKINNFEITWIDDTDGFTISTEEIKRIVKENNIEIIAISHVQWMTGYKIDLKELGDWCKENNVIFIVDATQSLGAYSIDLKELNIDVFIASNYKWMNAGFGTGIMYAGKQFLQKYPPVVGGHNSYVMHEGIWQYIPSINSYEPGHPNMYGFTVLDTAIKHKKELTLPYIEQHNYRITEMLIHGMDGLNVRLIGPSTMENRSSIIFLKEENGLFNKLTENEIIVSNRGNIRISIHYYNVEQQIEKLLDVLKRI